MGLIVQKYGGTSVGTPERIQSVAKRIASARSEGHQLVVVVSAMGDTTDDLIDLAHKVSKDPPHREMDMLLTAGERISMALMSMALADLKISAVSLTGSQSGIITDPSHRRARIRRILGDRVRHGLAENKVVIVAGFQGVSETKEVTTLGRGGSDTSAVALAAALSADLCEIYTDVDGVYSADPRWVPNAKLWRKIPHDLMVEMATRGAGVLHPRSVELAKQFGVNLCVRNSFNQSEGTTVISSEDLRGMEEFRVTGVTADRNRALLVVELSRPTALAALWERATAGHLSVLAPFFSQGTVHFFIEKDAADEWRKHLEDLSVQGFVKRYHLESSLIPLSVVGDRFSQDGAALGQVIEILAQNHISVTMGAASALAITVAVSANHAQDGVKALHETLLAGASN
jgi:aspartate kinase